MLVAPPEALKTTAIEMLDEFANTKVVSDLNVQTLVGLKDDFLASKITTLAFSDFSKLYKRHGSVASNLEGIIMALCEEGFRKASFQSQSTASVPARCAIIGGMPNQFFEHKAEEWKNSGFLRRFLFAQYLVEGHEIIEQAVSEWRRAELDGTFTAKIPASRTIRYKLDDKEVTFVRHICRHQHGITPFILMQKIMCVLKWKFGEKESDAPMKILKDFAPCLGKDGGVLIIREKQ